MSNERAGGEIRRNDEEKQFEIALDGTVALIAYRIAGRNINLVHTEVPPEFEGRGVGGALVRAALDYAREQKLMVVASCPFAAAYIERHPAYHDLVVG